MPSIQGENSDHSLKNTVKQIGNGDSIINSTINFLLNITTTELQQWKAYKVDFFSFIIITSYLYLFNYLIIPSRLNTENHMRLPRNPKD